MFTPIMWAFPFQTNLSSVMDSITRNVTAIFPTSKYCRFPAKLTEQRRTPGRQPIQGHTVIIEPRMNPADSSTELTLAQPTGEVSAEMLATLAEIGEEVNASLDLDVVLSRTAALIKKHIDYEIF